MVSKQGKMERQDRAKQFMPFDALKGFREALLEKEEILVPERDLTEEEKEKIDRKLRLVGKNDLITVEYFLHGRYIQVKGLVSGLEEADRILEIVNTRIPFDDIVYLQGEKFPD